MHELRLAPGAPVAPSTPPPGLELLAAVHRVLDQVRTLPQDGLDPAHQMRLCAAELLLEGALDQLNAAKLLDALGPDATLPF